MHLTDDTAPPTPVRTVRADALERADTAWRARVAGATWTQAAQVAGFTDGHNAFRAVKSVYGAAPDVSREDLRALWRARLEVMWRQAQVDMREQRPGAVVGAVRVAGVAVTLDGLAEPVKVDVALDTFTSLSEQFAAEGL